MGVQQPHQACAKRERGPPPVQVEIFQVMVLRFFIVFIFNIFCFIWSNIDNILFPQVVCLMFNLKLHVSSNILKLGHYGKHKVNL